MKPYRFRLQTVLDYRSEQVNLIQQQVAEAEAARMIILNRIQEYDQAIEQAFADQQQMMNDSVLDVARAQTFPGYVWRLRQFRFQEFQVLQQQERRVAIIREQLKQAQIKKRALEVLKDKDLAKYKKQVEKAEEAFLEEIALNRYRHAHL